MTTLTKSTQSQKLGNIKRGWHVVDLRQQILGRVTTQIATFLQGKHKVTFTPNLDVGDYVVVVNAKHLNLTGRKKQTESLTRYSGYPGGLKIIKVEKLLAENPQEIVRHAVSGMLPKNKLRQKRLARLFVFPQESHPYEDKFKKPEGQIKSKK